MTLISPDLVLISLTALPIAPYLYLSNPRTPTPPRCTLHTHFSLLLQMIELFLLLFIKRGASFLFGGNLWWELLAQFPSLKFYFLTITLACYYETWRIFLFLLLSPAIHTCGDLSAGVTEEGRSAQRPPAAPTRVPRRARGHIQGRQEADTRTRTEAGSFIGTMRLISASFSWRCRRRNLIHRLI